MGGKVVHLDNLAKYIAQEMEKYSEDVSLEVKAAVDVVATKVNETIKQHVTFKQPTGNYVKAFRIKTTEETKCSKHKIWYVAKPHYRLTHLLENGHALRNGGRARAFPHIKYGEELALDMMLNVTKEAIERAGNKDMA